MLSAIAFASRRIDSIVSAVSPTPDEDPRRRSIGQPTEQTHDARLGARENVAACGAFIGTLRRRRARSQLAHNEPTGTSKYETTSTATETRMQCVSHPIERPPKTSSHLDDVRRPPRWGESASRRPSVSIPFVTDFPLLRSSPPSPRCASASFPHASDAGPSTNARRRSRRRGKNDRSRRR